MVRNASIIAPRSHIIWPMLALVGVALLLALRKQAIPYDAVHTYLPAAKQLLSEGTAFFMSPESYRMAPLAYIWPALWQLDVDAMRMANTALFMISAAMLWQTAGLLGGRRAAWLATSLFVFNPELWQYFAAGWTEPFYVTGISALFLASAQLILGAPRPARWIALGAFGLAMTLLGRPVLQLMAPAMLLACVLIAWWPTARWTAASSTAKPLAFMLALGLVPALVVVVKNGVLFNLWGIATGAGTGLYLGLHPISQGTEPAYYGFDYDVNAVALLIPSTQGDHLGLETDRFLRAIAIETLKDYAWPQQLTFMARKLWWWLFHHPIGLEVSGKELRGIRIFEILSIVGGSLVVAWLWLRQGQQRVIQQFARQGALQGASATAIGERRAIATGLLLLGVLVLILQLVPVLYNIRYSTGLLEPWLCVLTGVSWFLMSQFVRGEVLHDGAGVSWTLSARGAHHRAIVVKLALLTLILITAVLFAHHRRIERASMDPLPRNLPTTVLARIEATEGVETTSISRAGTTSWRLFESPGALVMPMTLPSEATSHPTSNYLWRLRFAVSPPDGRKCRYAEVGYTASQGSRGLAPPLLDVAKDGEMHEYLIHATHDLGPAGSGDLRIAYHCPVGTIVTWGGGEMVYADVLQRWRALASSFNPSAR